MPLSSAVHTPGPIKVVSKGEKWSVLNKAGQELGEYASESEARDAYCDGCDRLKANCSCGQRNMSLAPTESIAGVEIFAVGEWNGDSYTEKDLDTLVASFQETASALKPYLKLGHGDKQGLLEADELPAAGWITHLYRSGQKLMADFTGIPRKIADLIKAGAYKRVSAEIYVSPKVNGKTYDLALKAVALLGGETPAVSTLADIHALYALDAAVVAYGKECATKVYELNLTQEVQKPAPETDKNNGCDCTTEDFNMAGECEGKLKAMEEKYAAKCEEMDKMSKKLSESEAKVATLEKDHADLTAKFSAVESEKAELSKKFSAVSEELSKEQEVRHCSEINAKLDKFIAEKKIVPAQREALFALLKNSRAAADKKFTLAEKEVQGEEAIILAFIEAGTSVGLPTSGQTEVGKNQPADLASKAKAYAEKHKVSLRDATIAVSAGKA